MHIGSEHRSSDRNQSFLRSRNAGLDAPRDSVLETPRLGCARLWLWHHPHRAHERTLSPKWLVKGKNCSFS